MIPKFPLPISSGRQFGIVPTKLLPSGSSRWKGRESLLGHGTALLCCLLVSIALADPAVTEPSRPFSVVMAQWTRILDDAQRYVQGPDHSQLRSDQFQSLSEQVESEARAAQSRAESRADAVDQLLQALGKRPSEGEPPEPENIASKRQQYAQDLTDYRARAALARLTATRANQLENSVNQLTRLQMRALVSERAPLPLSPRVIAKAVPEALSVLEQMAIRRLGNRRSVAGVR